ncbi:MAG: hypothetical protein K8L97_04300 [Anaerolineae bacterium]|nr:hypothetical protein [Anaerolineae bacterium]
MTSEQTPQEYFHLILLTVVGQAFTAAGYVLEDDPVRWAGGMFRFAKSLDSDLNAFIEFQLLAYVETQWASRQPSRFRITLTRTDQSVPALPSLHSNYARRDLSALVVEDFGVAILPSAAHWWVFSNTDELGKALAEAGHLVIGYGMPWLSGDLIPPLD